MQTVCSLTPIIQEAKDWVNINVQSEPYQWFGDSLAVEHRYIEDIIDGLIEAGLLPNRDFSVS